MEDCDNVAIISFLFGVMVGVLLLGILFSFLTNTIANSDLDDVCKDFFGEGFGFDQVREGDILCKEVSPVKAIGRENRIGCGDCVQKHRWQNDLLVTEGER